MCEAAGARGGWAREGEGGGAAPPALRGVWTASVGQSACLPGCPSVVGGESGSLPFSLARSPEVAAAQYAVGCRAMGEGSGRHPQPIRLLLHEEAERDEARLGEVVPAAGVHGGPLGEAVPLRHLLAHDVEEDAVRGEHVAHHLPRRRAARRSWPMR